jgi:hypothetical protein
MLRAERSVSLALIAGLLLAVGCGGGDGGGDDVASVSGDEEEAAQGDESSEEQQEQELLDWVECMNEEGVEIPDPVRDENGDLVIEGNGINIGGGGVRVGGGSQEDPAAEEEPPFSREDMEAATEVCGPPPMVGAGDMSEEEQQERQDDALAFSECMRAEGIEDFPDPDFSDEGPGGETQAQTSEGSEGDGGEGPDQQIVVGPFGEIDMDDPEVAAAFEACQDELGMPEGGPGGGGGNGAEPAEDSEG